jgi:hypothetical protein
VALSVPTPLGSMLLEGAIVPDRAVFI